MPNWSVKKALASKFLIYFVAAAAIGAAAYVFWPKPQSPYSYISVQKGNIVQTVSVTGQVVAAHSVDLAFTQDGQIASIAAEVGHSVAAGEALASLDTSSFQASLAQAEANLRVQQADLASLLSGSTSQQISVKQAEVQSAQTSLAGSAQTLLNSIQNAYVSANDAVRNKTDEIFANPTSNNPQLVITISDQQLQFSLLNARQTIQSVLNGWSVSNSALATGSNLDSAASSSLRGLNQVADFLTSAAEAVNEATPAGSVSSATLSSWQSEISAARFEVADAVNSLSAAQSAYSSAVSSLNLAEKELALTEASATTSSIAAAEAQVAQAQANVKLYQDQISKATIYSPISGLVTAKNIKVGETIAANSPAFIVISKDNFQIETYVADSDIAKVAVGNQANVTLDAYGDAVSFKAAVISIDPGETVIEGVPTYKVMLKFLTQPQPVKSGMTANIDIVTATKNDVLIIPQRSVIYENGQNFVLLRSTSTVPIKTLITTGLTGSDGTEEVVSGLKAGDEIVNYTTSGGM